MKIQLPLKVIFGTLVCLLLFGFMPDGNETIKVVATKLENWTAEYPQEKVYLHLDKPYYAAGDSIWFKAYLTAGPQHELSTLSGVLQVELVNEQNEVQHSINLPVTAGVAWGDIALPGNLPAGNYRLRAYTNWMRNFGDDYFYDEPITIGSASAVAIQTTAAYSYSGQQTNATLAFTDTSHVPLSEKPVNYVVLLDGHKITEGKGKTDATGKLALAFATQTTLGLTSYRLGQIVSKIVTGPKDTVTRQVTFNPAAAQTDVQFFPEGGNLVTGISSAIAFKAVGANGLGMDINGQVFDNGGNKVADFSTQHLGMGSFILVPEQSKTYYAVINYPDGSKRTLNLPNAQSSGYALSITATGKNHRIRIAASADMPADETLSLVAQQGGKIYYAGTAQLTGGGFSASLPDSRFPAGIVQFTLFSGKGQPLAERLVFINNDSALLNVGVASAKNTYAPHDNTKIDLHIQNNEGKAVVGSFSASVINEDKLPVRGNNENNILSNLLLTSDLQGYIEQPGYYFKSGDEKAAADLDVLMLTQGYRRFTWKQLLDGSLPVLAYKPQTGISVSGRVTAYGKPVANGKVTLFTTTGGTIMTDTLSDADGKFSFNNLQFTDSVTFTIQARTAKGKNDVEVNIDNPVMAGAPGPRMSNDLLGAKSLSPAYTEYLKDKQQQYQYDLKYTINGHTTNLKTVTIKAQRAVLQHSANLNGPGVANQVLMGDEVFKNKGCTSPLECLEGRLVGVNIIGKSGPLSQLTAKSMRSGGIMQVYIDGGPSDMTQLNNINPNDIESIEILTSRAYTAIYGGDGSNGIILVNTKHGNDDPQSTRHIKAPGVITYSPKGLYVAREFYKPVYKAPPAIGQKDTRSTIDWENNLITDKDGNISFSYFNAAGKGTYRVTVEGIDTEGHLGRQVYRYKVE